MKTIAGIICVAFGLASLPYMIKYSIENHHRRAKLKAEGYTNFGPFWYKPEQVHSALTAYAEQKAKEYAKRKAKEKFMEELDEKRKLLNQIIRSKPSELDKVEQ